MEMDTDISSDFRLLSQILVDRSDIQNKNPLEETSSSKFSKFFPNFFFFFSFSFFFFYKCRNVAD